MRLSLFLRRQGGEDRPSREARVQELLRQGVRPVMPSTTLSLADKVDLKSRPERGLLVQHGRGHNQKGEVVYEVTGQILVPRRVPLKAAS